LKKVALMLAASFAALATPASAAIIVTTVNGTLVAGSVPANGIPNAFNLGSAYEGTTFNVVLTFDDTTVGASRSDNGANSSLSGVGPLACTGCFGAPGFAIVTINGISRRVGNDYGATLSRDLLDPARPSYFAESVGRPQGSGSESLERASIQVQGSNIFQLSDLTTALSHTSQPDDDTSFNYSFFDSDLPSGSLSLSGRISQIDVQVAGAVPEPATWAMLIVGFGLVGGMMRRRRSGMLGAASILLQRA
jgi:hypothetical protein